MKRLGGLISPGHAVAFILAVAVLGTGCATKGYVRKEVQASAGQLSTRIDANETTIRSHEEQIQLATNQISELSTLNRQNTAKIGTLQGDVQQVDGKAGRAQTAAERAQANAEGAATKAASVDERFTNRNRMGVLVEKIIPFKFNSAALESAYHADLTLVASHLKDNPDAILTVEGRTDNSGDADYNVQLGERRMNAVIRYLVVEQGVPMQRVHKMSFGEAQPIAGNETSAGRSKNRCTVVQVLLPLAQIKE